MTKMEDNVSPYLTFVEGTEPSAPSATQQRLYPDSTTHKFKRTDSSGVDVTLYDSGATAPFPPGYEFSYVEFTSNVSVTATVEASGDTVVTAAAVTFDGSTTVRIEFYSPGVKPDPTSGRWIEVLLFDGSSSIGALSFQNDPASVSSDVPNMMARRLTPSNASHTYSIRAFVSAGTGTVRGGAGGAGALMPGYIRITKV